MLSYWGYVIYYSWQKWRTSSLLAVTLSGVFFFTSGKEKGWVPRTGVTFQTQCNSGAIGRKIVSVKKKEMSNLGNVLQPPLTHKLCLSTLLLLWGQYGLHSRNIINSLDSTTVLCPSLLGSILIIQLFIYSKGWFSVLFPVFHKHDCCSWWDCW